jgi:hypothetical protein
MRGGLTGQAIQDSTLIVLEGVVRVRLAEGAPMHS